jgi:hypothetical protein
VQSDIWIEIVVGGMALMLSLDRYSDRLEGTS